MAFRPKWIAMLAALAALEATVRSSTTTNTVATSPSNTPASTPPPATGIAVAPLTGGSGADAASQFAAAMAPANTNAVAAGTNTDTASTLYTNLAMARYYVNTGDYKAAEREFIPLLDGDKPVALQKIALFELGNTVRAENEPARAQTIYTQYINRWPGDPKIPEVLLNQGRIFREMGLNDLALGKFYSVMTAALALKDDQLAYYQKLVLETQLEIAETHYYMGQFADAVDFYQRMLANSDSTVNRELIEFHLVRSLSIIGRNAECAAQAQDFINQFPDSDQVPETRYDMAQALKTMGRNSEALQQVLKCLQEQKSRTDKNPEVWAYWQQRIGNEIGNDLYHEGDYVNALEVYMNLEKLDDTPNWQIPVEYQMGMTYEKLAQPTRAIDTYKNIIARQNDVGTNSTPALQTVFDMAHWRINYIQWQTNADSVDRTVATIEAEARATTNSTPATP